MLPLGARVATVGGARVAAPSGTGRAPRPFFLFYIFMYLLLYEVLGPQLERTHGRAGCRTRYWRACPRSSTCR